ncbi:hypothetical protein G6F31_019687 [Rhizopus arrhizus]|nr:hypothetical protein G6F31_019687 [Rhizopus arrhizus]
MTTQKRLENENAAAADGSAKDAREVGTAVEEVQAAAQAATATKQGDADGRGMEGIDGRQWPGSAGSGEEPPGGPGRQRREYAGHGRVATDPGPARAGPVPGRACAGAHHRR